MHVFTEDEWREHVAVVRSLETAVIVLAKGMLIMSTATAAALAKLDTLEAKVDQFVAAKSSADAAALAADEADAAKIEDRIDGISAKLDAAMPTPTA